jgi:hypothetical protein
VAQLAALLLLLLGLLPIANWIPGGHQAPWYADRLAGWISGGAIVLGLGVIAGIALRRYPALWREGLWARVASAWRRRGLAADIGVALAGFAVYAAVSRLVLSARPLLIDEIIQEYQARIFASGRLWLPAPADPAFTSAQHLLDWGGKVFGQFPAGGPAMLALGALVGAQWLVGPVFAAIGVVIFARLLRRIELRDGTALAALLLFAFAPFCVFLDASAMNHVTETTWLLVAALGLAVAVADEGAHPWAALGCGLALGIAAAIRPLDAVVFALPTAVWLAARARLGRGQFITLLASGVGVALPIVALLLVNKSQTGDPFRFGYIAMWGKTHELGFHEAPWGFAHTPARGLELVNLYLLRLQTYFLEAPAPSLLFATAALALVPRLTAFDRWTLIGGAGLLLAYFAYWHDGFYLGPRFMLPLAPWLALWTARLPAVLAERRVAAPVIRGTVVAGVGALVIGGVWLAPIRAQQYRNGMLSMRFDADALAKQAGVRHALVFVRESWGAQLLSRMWALGVTRTNAERIYRTQDACRIEEGLGAIERQGKRAEEFEARLAPFAADSSRLVRLRPAPDTSLRFLPGARLTARCLRRIGEDRLGFTVFSPLLLARDTSVIYLRDLHERDSVAIARHPGRDLWLLTQDPSVGAALRFARIAPDSLRREWQPE